MGEATRSKRGETERSEWGGAPVIGSFNSAKRTPAAGGVSGAKRLAQPDINFNLGVLTIGCSN